MKRVLEARSRLRYRRRFALLPLMDGTVFQREACEEEYGYQDLMEGGWAKLHKLLNPGVSSITKPMWKGRRRVFAAGALGRVDVLRKGKVDRDTRVVVVLGAAMTGRVGVLDLFLSKCSQKVVEDIQIAADGGGAAATIVHLLRRGVELTIHGVMLVARAGRVDLLRELWSRARTEERRAVLSHPDILLGAIEGGDKATVRYLRGCGPDPAPRVCEWHPRGLHAAVSSGNVELVKWLRSDDVAGPSGERCPWDAWVLYAAVESGSMELVKWLRSDKAAGLGGEKCPWDAKVLQAAAMRRNVELVKWLRSEEAAGPDGQPCPWDEGVLWAAVKTGNLELVKWLRSDEAVGPGGERCPSNGAVVIALRRCRHAELAEWLTADIAARGE